MNICYYYIAVYLMASIDVHAARTVDDLHEEASAMALRLEKISLTSLQDKLFEADNYCAMLEEKYIDDSFGIISSMHYNLIQYKEKKKPANSKLNDEILQKFDILNQNKLEKCVKHATADTKVLIDAQKQVVNIIEDHIKELCLQPDKCKSTHEPRICYLNLLSNMRNVESNIPDKLKKITKEVTDTYDNLPKKLDGCVNKMVDDVVKNTPDIVPAVKYGVSHDEN